MKFDASQSITDKLMVQLRINEIANHKPKNSTIYLKYQPNK